MLPPVPRDFSPSLQGLRRHQCEHDKRRAAVVNDRRDTAEVHALLVPQRVRRNETANREAVAHRDPQVPVRVVKQARAVGQKKHRENDHRPAGEREGGGPFAEQRDRAERGEQRSGAARQRVNEGEISRPVAALQQERVAGLQSPAARNPCRVGPRNHRLIENPVSDQHGHVQRADHDSHHPHERQSAAGAFGAKIPRRMQERRDEDEREGEGGHGKVERTVPSPLSAKRATREPLPFKSSVGTRCSTFSSPRALTSARPSPAVSHRYRASAQIPTACAARFRGRGSRAIHAAA